MKRFFILMCVCLWVSISLAQENSENTITAANATQLSSVEQLDFSAIYTLSESASDGRSSIGADINIGWFVYAQTSDRFLLLDDTQTLRAVFSDGASTYAVPDVAIVDAVAFGDGFYAMLFTTDNGFSVWYDNLSTFNGTSFHIDITTDAIPSAIWVTCPEDAQANGIGCYASVEAFITGETRVLTLPTFETTFGNRQTLALTDENLPHISYAPADDDEAVVRIGRIPLPYVVTSSLDGIVKLWHIETGTILYEVDNTTGEPSVFGNINTGATHLVWRDNGNQTLYLLDFESGENREIASLNGEYAQWYFLSNDASVILAVNLGGEPNVVIWETATGERTTLGNYRDCDRPQPDMTHFTPDGTTLIIGCDTGLDIWRIPDNTQDE